MFNESQSANQRKQNSNKKRFNGTRSRIPNDAQCTSQNMRTVEGGKHILPTYTLRKSAKNARQIISNYTPDYMPFVGRHPSVSPPRGPDLYVFFLCFGTKSLYSAKYTLNSTARNSTVLVSSGQSLGALSPRLQTIQGCPLVLL